jgi:hypothetical protein
MRASFRRLIEKCMITGAAGLVLTGCAPAQKRPDPVPGTEAKAPVGEIAQPSSRATYKLRIDEKPEQFVLFRDAVTHVASYYYGVNVWILCHCMTSPDWYEQKYGKDLAALIGDTYPLSPGLDHYTGVFLLKSGNRHRFIQGEVVVTPMPHGDSAAAERVFSNFAPKMAPAEL